MSSRDIELDGGDSSQGSKASAVILLAKFAVYRDPKPSCSLRSKLFLVRPRSEEMALRMGAGVPYMTVAVVLTAANVCILRRDHTHVTVT